ncbi:hypothetical protein Zmor_000677 [Zophobas morio]|uniref:Serine protease snake n=1 Tax=Zophobas morio TaxID=2755281 RepID=A0AA38MRK8_9CUCU|nr:hypothetical protein Zmor_000677 [Zophobas morio]
MVAFRSMILSLMITSIVTLNEGEDCVMENNSQTGKCVDVYQCDVARKLLQTNQRPQHCGFNRQTELVCCPVRKKPLERISGTVSDAMCKKYHNVMDAPIPPLGVSNGELAEPLELPHMAAVGYYDGQRTVWLCGGTIISEEFILTASHCARHQDYGPPQVIRVGDLDLSTSSDIANPQDLPIEEFYTHPTYKAPSVYHDIALIKVKRPIVFDFFTQPACLHLNRNIPTTVLQVAGWGKTDFYGDSSSHLMKANITLVSSKECSERFPVHRLRMKSGIIDEMHICAGDASGRDTCPGDSGGPLYFQRECGSSCDILPHFVVVGVTSFGKGCGSEHSIGVYTRVSSYVPWIEKIVWG